MDHPQWPGCVLDPPSLSVRTGETSTLYILYDQNVHHSLTFIPTALLADKKMFGLSSGLLTNTGSHMCKELNMVASTSAGAVAVSAINGTFVNARKPPSLEKDSRKSLPLREISRV